MMKYDEIQIQSAINAGLINGEFNVTPHLISNVAKLRFPNIDLLKTKSKSKSI
ncbi:hypothetical protein NCTGTJJY_CDS0146 [Serratia phage 92A1]|nr:hypothetical protein NCTGTJJY_CDS0146 [Serratia phage 92A1]